MTTIVRDGVASDELVGLHSAYCNTMAKSNKELTPVLSYLSPTLKNLHTADGMVPYGQRSYKYKELQYLPGRTTLNGDIAAAASSIVLTDKICRPGDIVVVGDEAITLGASDDYLTFACTKSTFTGSDAAHSDGDNVYLFGTSYPEGSNAPTAGAIPQSTEVTTNTDIFLDSAKVTGSARYMEQYAEGNMDKVIEYTEQIALSLKKQMQTRALYSDYQASAGETTAGRFDGAYERIAGTNYIDFSSSDITYPDVQKMFRKCSRKGHVPKVLFVSDYQGHNIDQWIQSYEQVNASEIAMAIFGSHVRAVRVGNYVLDIISTDEMDTNCLMCTPENFGFGPKDASRVLHPELLGKVGDYERIQVVGEYTCEWMLPYSACWGKSVSFV